MLRARENIVLLTLDHTCDGVVCDGHAHGPDMPTAIVGLEKANAHTHLVPGRAAKHSSRAGTLLDEKTRLYSVCAII